MFLFKFSDIWHKEFWSDFWHNHLKDWLIGPFLKFVVALIVFLICLKIVDVVSKKIVKQLNSRQADKTLTNVLLNIITKLVKVLLFLTFLAYVGIETASISALIASFGVGIGLALQGALSNFAGGILIILTRPFRVGDYIEAQGQSGTVENIHICFTEITTPDNVVIMIPNGTLANGVIVNKSMKDTRRVDVVFSISYESDYSKAEAVILDVCAKNKAIFTDPQPFCRVTEHSSSSIDLTCRVWVKSEDYWDVKFYLLEEVKTALDKNKIEIPYNKLDVNLNTKK